MPLNNEDLVALLAEGVDRNKNSRGALTRPLESPSSRRAWIEILIRLCSTLTVMVALLAEGVDRNQQAQNRNPDLWRRPPRGGRG